MKKRIQTKKIAPDFSPGKVSLAVVSCGVLLLTVIALLTATTL